MIPKKTFNSKANKIHQTKTRPKFYREGSRRKCVCIITHVNTYVFAPLKYTVYEVQCRPAHRITSRYKICGDEYVYCHGVVRVFRHTHTHTRARTHTYTHTHTHTYTYIHSHIHPHIYTYTHIHIHIHTHIYIYIYIHTHTTTHSHTKINCIDVAVSVSSVYQIYNYNTRHLQI